MKKKTIVRITSMAMAAMLTVSQLGLVDGIRVFAGETAEGEAGDSSAVTAESVTLQDSDGMTIAVAKRDWRVSFDYE